MGWTEGAVIVYFIVTFSRRYLNLCGSFLLVNWSSGGKKSETVC